MLFLINFNHSICKVNILFCSNSKCSLSPYVHGTISISSAVIPTAISTFKNIFIWTVVIRMATATSAANSLSSAKKLGNADNDHTLKFRHIRMDFVSSAIHFQELRKNSLFGIGNQGGLTKFWISLSTDVMSLHLQSNFI